MSMPQSNEEHRLLGLVGFHSRRIGNPVKLAEARRDLAVFRITRSIVESMEGSAPLTPEQVDQLTAAIREAGSR